MDNENPPGIPIGRTFYDYYYFNHDIFFYLFLLLAIVTDHSTQSKKIIENRKMAENAAIPVVSNDGGAASASEGAAPPLEVSMPLEHLETLERQLSWPKWSIPIFADQALDLLLRAYRAMCLAGKTNDPLLIRFENGSLLNAFEKLTISTAVTNWSMEVLVSHVGRFSSPFVEIYIYIYVRVCVLSVQVINVHVTFS